MDETKGKILIINSSGDITDAIEPAIRSARVASVSAPNLGAAVEYLQKNSPALILVDFDGSSREHIIKACSLIKRIPRCSNTEIHLIASQDPELESMVKKAKADGYILKPMSGPSFLKWLRENPDILDNLEKIPQPAAPVAPAPVPEPVVEAPPAAPVAPAPVPEPVVEAPPAAPVAPAPAPEPVVEAPPAAPVAPAPVPEPVVEAPPAAPVAPAPVPEPVVEAPPAAPVAPAPVPEPVVEAPPVAPVAPAPVPEPVVEAPPVAPQASISEHQSAMSKGPQSVILIGECDSLDELKTTDTGPLGLEFHFAPTMAEGAALLKTTSPVSIVIDFNLSDVPGGQACSILRQIPECANTAIVMIGDELEAVVTGQLSAIGASGYLMKPFSTVVFLSYLSERGFIFLPEELKASLAAATAASTVVAPAQPSADSSPMNEPAPQYPPSAPETLLNPEPSPQPSLSVPSSDISEMPEMPDMAGLDDLPDMDFDIDLPVVTLEPTVGGVDSTPQSNFDRHLRTGSLDNRISVCLSLGEQRNAAAVPALVSILEEGDENMLTEVCWSLGEIGHPSAIPALVELMNGRMLLYKSKAIEALGKIGHESAVVHIVKIMSDVPPELKIPIIRALEKIRGDDSRKALEFLSADTNYNVAKLAQEVLAGF